MASHKAAGRLEPSQQAHNSQPETTGSCVGTLLLGASWPWAVKGPGSGRSAVGSQRPATSAMGSEVA